MKFSPGTANSLFGHSRQQVLFDVTLKVKGTCPTRDWSGWRQEMPPLGVNGSAAFCSPDQEKYFVGQFVSLRSQAGGGGKIAEYKLSMVFQDYTTSKPDPRFRVRYYRGRLRGRGMGRRP